MHCEDVVVLFSYWFVLFLKRLWSQLKINPGPVELRLTLSVTHVLVYLQLDDIYGPQNTVTHTQNRQSIYCSFRCSLS